MLSLVAPGLGAWPLSSSASLGDPVAGLAVTAFSATRGFEVTKDVARSSPTASTLR